MAAAEDMLCLMMTTMMMMPLMMPFIWGILFGMHLVNLQETQEVCHKVHPCFEGHTVVAIIMETMAAVEDMLWPMRITTMPLMMLFIGHILFGMHLVNSQKTQVVCC
jgi:hypothetical protein